MLIASLALNDFLLLKDSGITELSVTFTELVQIIIGSNGSGKTSVLNQLSVYPSVRSKFGKQGFKSLVVEKDGIYYRLESEYEKPSSPHLFFEGDSEENLNVGRTTQTQQDLIIQYLGITPLVDDLIMNRYVFPKWTVSRRKEFLMGANPAQIGFVLTQIKQMTSNIKACKNNIARLQSRKILLEQDLLDDSMMVMLEAEKQTISDDLGAFQQNLMDIEIGLRTLTTIPTTLSLSDLPAIRKTVKRCHYQLASLSHVNRDDHQRQLDRETILSKIAVCDQRLVEADEEILKQSADLGEMEVKYRELSFDEDLQSVDETIQRLESERDKLQLPRPPFELSEDELQTKYRELETLQNRLQIFSTRTVTLLSSKRRQHRERMLQQAQYRQTTYRMRLIDLQNQHSDLSKRHSIQPRDIPDAPCAKMACPLYAHFMGEYQNSEQQRQQVEQSIQEGIRKTERLNRYVDGLIRHRDASKPYVDQIQWLVNYAQSNPILHHLLRQMDILSVLSTNPNRILRQLQDAYDRLAQWLKLKAVMADLETAYAFKTRQISSESRDTIKLVAAIEFTKKSLYGLRNVITRVMTQKRRLERDLADITSFSTIKSTILAIQEQHQIMAQALAQGHEKDKLDLLRRGIEQLRNHHFLRMSDIERTLRSQSSLRERYQEEVLSQLVLIEKELADQQQIEAALIAIPKENMIGFVNSLFKQANRLIETIWTVPLKIELLKPEDPLNYEFYVSGDNQSIREIGECSEGQTEILSLAINLSLRIVLGHLNFPLCLDEAGRTFDDKHKQNLIHLLRRLLDDKIISQLFLVNHHASIHEGFSHSETMVIREDNVLLPEVYNHHVTFK